MCSAAFRGFRSDSKDIWRESNHSALCTDEVKDAWSSIVLLLREGETAEASFRPTAE